MNIEKIGIIGGGLMGSGIAEINARAGLSVVIVEVDDTGIARAQERISVSLDRAESRGKITAEDAQAVRDHIRYTTDLADLADRDLVIEAASEHENTKLGIFENVGKILENPNAVLASNTSSIPIVKLGAISGRPDRVMGVHFFNPAPVMKLVELIPSLTTSEETLGRMRNYVTDTLGKKPIDATDRAGFIVNSLLVPYLLSAIRMYEAGYASAKDIDSGMILGCGHPMGPLALSDLIGLDTIQAIGESMYEEFKEPLYSPPPLLDRMVDAGLLGKKSGQGFYPYE